MDWSEWHPSGTVALDWLPLDMFHICVMIAAGLHYFGTKGIITLDPPFVPSLCHEWIELIVCGLVDWIGIVRLHNFGMRFGFRYKIWIVI